MDRRTVAVWLLLFGCFAGCTKIHPYPRQYTLRWELHGREYSKSVQSMTVPRFYYTDSRTNIYYVDFPSEKNTYIYLHRDAAPLGEDGVEEYEPTK